MINIDDFQKIELRIARIKSAERVEGSEKLLRFIVSLGSEERQILGGFGRAYDPGEMVGKEIVIVANLAPRMMMGFESNGMILAATDEAGIPVLICPEKDVSEGTGIR